MKLQHIALLISFLAFEFVCISQPYVVNEKVEKVFSEGFTDINKSFIITPSSDPKFWATYGDGYYFMQRKIGSPRAVIANTDPISKNFYIKSKIILAPLGTSESSVGIIFLAQKGGKGGFVFEISKKKKFRIKDLGTNAFITKEGDNGWLKSKSIAPPTRNNTIEIKGFRGQFDIYINGDYIYSFVNSSYESGKFGTYIGPNSEARIYYYNVYKLDIPGVEPEVNLDKLNQQIETLKNENDSLKTIVLTEQYDNDNKTAISAIKILEKQLQSVNEENAEIKAIIKKQELNSSSASDSINQLQSMEFLRKLKMVRFQRDSILDAFTVIQTLYDKSNFIQDSLENEIMENKTRIGFKNEELSQLKLEIAESKLTKEIDSSFFITKTTSKPSKISTIPKTSIDSISTTSFEKSLPAKTNSSDSELIRSSASSKNFKINKDSLFIKVVKNNKEENLEVLQDFKEIDSSKYSLVAVRTEFKVEDSLNTNRIDSLINSKSKSTTSINIIKDSVIVSLQDTTQKKSNDSNLLQLTNKQSALFPLDTIAKKKEINITIDTIGAIELLKKDSIYFHTLDIDEDLEVDENKFTPSSIDSIKSVKIKVNKTELKD
jgi:hypothetical protein